MLAPREVSRPTRRRPRSGREWGRLTKPPDSPVATPLPKLREHQSAAGPGNVASAIRAIQWLPCSGYEQLTVSHLGVRIEEVGTWVAVRGVIVHTGVAAGQPVIAVFATQRVVVRSAVEDVVLGTATHDVCAKVAVDLVVVGAAVDEVAASAAVDRVDAVVGGRVEAQESGSALALRLADASISPSP